MMKIEEIMNILPHRYPFLLVDRIVEVEAERIVGIKNVTFNEPFFQGHFPGRPIMPGVLIVEAMAQVGGCLMTNIEEELQGRIIYFMGIDRARFRRPVVPGDQLVMEVKLLHRRSLSAKLQATARVDGKVVAEATLLSMLAEK